MSCGCGSCVSCQNLYSIPTGIPGIDGIDGVDGVDGKGYDAISLTSLDVLDTQVIALVATITVEKAYLGGSRVRFTDDSDTDNYFEAIVNTYNTTTGALTGTIDFKKGSGTIANWNVSLAAPLGSRVLYNNQTPVQTTGTPEEDLMLYQLPFNVFTINNGDRIIIKGAFGTTLNPSANVKNVKVYFDANVVLTTNMNFDWPAASADFVQAMYFTIELTRVNSVLMYRTVKMEFGTGAFGVVNEIDLTQQSSFVPIDLNNPVNYPMDIKMTGEAATGPEVIDAIFLTVDLIKG